MRTIVAVIALSLLACGDSGSGPDDGPLRLSIAEGNHQVTEAGADELLDPVTGRLVRLPSGEVALHLVRPLYAQTTVGTPVANAVVCAVAVPDAESGLTPFAPCVNTNSQGDAIFHFQPGTKAGEAQAEVRSEIDGQPAVHATVTAIVEPGPADGSPGYLGITEPGQVHEYYSYGVDPQGECNSEVYHDAYGNPITYRVTTSQFLAVGGATLGTPESCTVTLSDTTVVAGDTATMRLLREGDVLLLDLLVTVTGPIEHPDYAPNGVVPVQLTARIVNY